MINGDYMFRVFIVLIIVFLVLMILYNINKIRKLSIIQKINNKFLQIIVSMIPFAILFILFNYVNLLVILIHLFIFFNISNFLHFIVEKITHKKINTSYFTVIAIIITSFYLGIGAYLDYHVFETNYKIETDKELGTENFRIIQISDSHVGATFDGNGFYEHMKKISQIDSDILVITGDFVDDDTTWEDMIKSCEALALAKPKYGIYFIYGNHDKGYFNYRNFTDQELRIELKKHDIHVLNDEVYEINDFIYLIGRNDKTDTNRKSIQELTSNLNKEKYIIDLNHQPNDYQNEKGNVDLVLSGHTHGGQLFPLGYIGLLTGANDEFYGLHKRDNTYFIVNSGISDWAIDFKTGTKSEYVIIDIKTK